MKQLFLLSISFLLSFFIVHFSFAEGTCTINPQGWNNNGAGTTCGASFTNGTCGGIAILVVNRGVTSLDPQYSGNPNARLNVRVLGGETLYFGFGGLYRESDGGNGTNVNLQFRIRRASDNAIVFAQTALPTVGQQGYIGINNANGFNNSCAGPIQLTGNATAGNGYWAYQLNVPTSVVEDDYYIEFRKVGDADPSINGNTLYVQFFDFTVARSVGRYTYNGTTVTNTGTGSTTANVRTGRLWSRIWSFTVNSGNNRFEGSLYPYTSTDNVVFEVDFNDMRPINYTITHTRNGIYPPPTPFATARQSVRTSTLNQAARDYVDFPIFVNPPEEREAADPVGIVLFPSEAVGCLESVTASQCSNDEYCINVKSDAAGTADVTLLLSSLGAPYTDFVIQNQFIDNDNDGDGDDEVTCVTWDGRDGNGNAVPEGSMFNIRVDFFTGLTNLPMADVEEHPNGFQINLVRPTQNSCGQPLLPPKLYWDDSQIISTKTNAKSYGEPNVQLVGANPPAHRWRDIGENDGTSETINTWWYIGQQEQTISFTPDNSLFDIAASFDGNVNDNCRTFQNGDFVDIELIFSENKFSFADIAYAPNNILPAATSLTFVSATDDGLIGGTPQKRKYTIRYQINTGGGSVDDLEFDFVAQASNFCSTPATSTRNYTCTLLPITLLNLNAKNVARQSTFVYWSTANELSNKGFYVERSIDGENFQRLGFVEGKGTTNRVSEYEFLDNEYWIGRAYYRLVQLDFNGEETLSKVVTVERSEINTGIVLYPNPNQVGQELQLRGVEKLAVEKIDILSLAGQKIETELNVISTSEGIKMQLPTSLARGTYIVQVITIYGTDNYKLIIE